MLLPFPPTPPSLERADAEPDFLSNSFQNLRLSSAAKSVLAETTGREDNKTSVLTRSC